MRSEPITYSEKKDIIGIIHVLLQRRLDDLPSKQNKHDTKRSKTAGETRREKDKAKKRTNSTCYQTGQKKKITTTYLKGDRGATVVAKTHRGQRGCRTAFVDHK